MTTDWSPAGTFRAFLEHKRSPVWLSAKNSSGFFGVLFGLVPDEATEAFILTCRQHLLADKESPDDILPLIAKDRGLPRYYLETAAEHRDRLLKAWDIYEYAGTEYVIERQIFAAGFGPDVLMGDYGDPDVEYGSEEFYYADLGAYVQFRPWETGPRGEPAPYVSQFWVVFAEGFHPITGGAAPWGTWTWGETWLNPEGSGIWSLQGLTNDFYRTILGIVKKWKPSDFVFRGFTFIINDINYGDEDLDYGDDTIIYGGALELPVPLQ